jgi:hypothetical protein
MSDCYLIYNVKIFSKLREKKEERERGSKGRRE